MGKLSDEHTTSSTNIKRLRHHNRAAHDKTAQVQQQAPKYHENETARQQKVRGEKKTRWQNGTAANQHDADWNPSKMRNYWTAREKSVYESENGAMK